MSLLDDTIQSAETTLLPYFLQLEARCHVNFKRVLEGFLANGLSENHFASVTGYGHNDLGREVTDNIFAHALGAEAALVRLQFVSGTHAIAAALMGALGAGCHGKLLVSLTGNPYDTLEEVIGTRGSSPRSLAAQGVDYAEIDPFTSGRFSAEFGPAQLAVLKKADVAFIQRSRGYSLRPSLSIADIAALIAAARKENPRLLVVVDNCYGEFVETREPASVGADLLAGSLIKNPGGGIVTTGGYVAGKKALVQAAADVLTAPGIGAKGGYTFDATRTILQGLYFAPNVTKEALRGMRLAAQVFHQMGYKVTPSPQEAQNDIIQVIQLENEAKVLGFCRALQSVSPVDARLTPVPAITPGYGDPVVMAGGTFIFGSTIELSCDAPMRPPYSVFLQGGLVYSHTRVALQKILEQVAAPVSPVA